VARRNRALQFDCLRQAGSQSDRPHERRIGDFRCANAIRPIPQILNPLPLARAGSAESRARLLDGAPRPRDRRGSCSKDRLREVSDLPRQETTKVYHAVLHDPAFFAFCLGSTSSLPPRRVRRIGTVLNRFGHLAVSGPFCSLCSLKTTLESGAIECQAKVSYHLCGQ
jgi:hypothetical protein